ncbi:hypothetical protein DFJ74DRAFT_697465 [Hyaloraphidium curvatum]|nr:hypothetical protein DFJ74DRAFT_697465 [Hyaloraphidium curvatum]
MKGKELRSVSGSPSSNVLPALGHERGDHRRITTASVCSSSSLSDWTGTSSMAVCGIRGIRNDARAGPDDTGCRSDFSERPRVPRPATAMADQGDAGNDPLIATFFEMVPVAITMFPRAAFWEARRPGFRGDPRWAALAHAPPVVSAMRWIGSRFQLGRAAHLGTDDVPELAAKTKVLEAECTAALAASLKDFWHTYGEGVPGVSRTGSFGSSAGRGRGSSVSGAASGDLSSSVSPHLSSVSPHDTGHGPGTPATLALHYGLNFAASAADYEAGSQPTVLRLLRHAADVFRASGLPAAALTSSPLPHTLDDWLWTQLHIDIFLGDVFVDLAHATLNHRPTVFNMPREMPEVRLRAPILRTSMLPPPSKRPPNALVPDDLYDVFHGLNMGQCYGFLDPDFLPQPAPDELAARLSLLVGDVVTAGYGPLAFMVHTLSYHVGALGAELDVAGFSFADLALADDLLAGRAGLGAQRAIDVLDHPSSASFQAKRDHLRRAKEAIWTSLDPRLRAVVDAGFDVSALRVLFPLSPDPFLIDVVSVLGFMKRTELLLVSPEPFSDLVEGAKRSPGRTRRRRGAHPPSVISLDSESEVGSQVTQDERTTVAWMRSSAFAEACSSAFSLGAMARALVASFPLPVIARARIVPHVDRAIVSAAWFSIFVLRRFPVAPDTHSADFARLGELHRALEHTARACLDVLAAGDRPEVEPVRLLLRDLLEGERQTVSRREAKMLLIARKTPADCPHGNPGGRCWTCASQPAPDGEEGELELMPGMPGHLDVRRGSDARRRVVFSDEDEVGETFAKGEYARSFLAPDEDEEEGDETADEQEEEASVTTAAEQSFSLTLLLEQWDLARNGRQTVS